MVGILGQDILTGTGGHRGAGGHQSAESLHDAAAIGLLLIADLYLIDGGLDAEQLGSIAQGCTPLAGTRLSGDVGDAFFLEEVHLREGGIDLVRAQRIHALVLEVDVSGRAQRFLQSVGTDKRRTAVIGVELAHLFRNFNPSVGCVELLLGSTTGEDVTEVINRYGLTVRCQHGHRLVRHLGLNVVPFFGNLRFLKDESFLFHCCLLFEVSTFFPSHA